MTATGYCYGEGPKPAKVMLVAEKPGTQELKVGRPFVGIFGEEIDMILWRTGLKREELYITNLVKDRPTGDDWSVTDEDIKRNEAALWTEIAQVNPSIIATVGAVSTNYFLRESDVDYTDMRTVHAIPFSVDSLPGVTLLPVWHPAAGLHEDPNAYQYIFHDFRQLKKVAEGHRLPTRVDRHDGKEHYIDWNDKFPGPQALIDHVRGSGHLGWIAIDTEGKRGDEWGMLSWSTKEGEGYVVRPTERNTLAALREVIRQEDLTVIMHYGLHDIDILRGFDVWSEDFRWIDTMVEAYILCLEPQGLKALAYRRCGMKMKSYVNIVSPYSLDLQIDYLLRLQEEEWETPEPIIEDKKTHVKITNPQDLGRRISGIINDMEKGKDVDVYKRWYDIHRQVRDPAERRFGILPVANLSHVPEDVRIRYSGRDADATGRVHRSLRAQLEAEGLAYTADMDMACLPMVEEMQRVGIKGDADYFRGLIKKYNGQQGRIRKQIFDMIGYSINPESPPDVQKVLFKTFKLPVYKKSKKTRAPSTGQKAIEGLKDAHPIVPLVLNHRKIDKNKNSFCKPLIEAIESNEDGRARTNFKYTRVASGRYSAEEPNLLAIPVRTDLGLEIRNGFHARDGYYLGSWDQSQIEMRFMGHESQDENLIRAFREDRDIHTETAAKMFGIRMEDVSKSQRYGAKRTGFGVITGITGHGLLDQFRMEGITEYDEDDCNYFIKGWLDVNAKVKYYMSQCRAEAKRYGYVTESIGGRRRYLPGVHSTDPRIREEALRQTHSHKISAGAQAIMKLSMIKILEFLNELNLDIAPERVWWLLQIHDEIILEFPKGLETTLDPIIKSIMATTVKLSVPIKASGSWNERWGKLK